MFEKVTKSIQNMITRIYCGQVHNIYNYTKQHLHIYTCKRDYITLFTFFYIFESDSVCGRKMLKSIKRYTSAVGKDL